MLITHPQAAGYCFGHDHAKTIFETQIMQQCLGQAWLFSGDKGIGKATFAYYCAVWLLQESMFEPDAPLGSFGESVKSTSSYRAINNQTHPDFYSIEAEQEGDLTIEKVRSLTHFLQKTPSLGKRRIAIIDGVNWMTRQAANALLKTLEEPPPHAILFLISHAQTLITLKSRCQRLIFHPLPSAVVEKILTPYILNESSARKSTLFAYLQGHPGIFYYFQDEKFHIIEALQTLEEKRWSYQDILTFADTYKESSASIRYGLLFWMAHTIEKHYDDLYFIQKGAELWSETNALFNEFQFFNMDFSQVIVKIFEKVNQWLRTENT
jgi:DNA polymerase-3 subunit delta'